MLRGGTVPGKDHQIEEDVHTHTHVWMRGCGHERKRKRQSDDARLHRGLLKESPETPCCSLLLIVPLYSKPLGSGLISGDYFHFRFLLVCLFFFPLLPRQPTILPLSLHPVYTNDARSYK